MARRSRIQSRGEFLAAMAHWPAGVTIVTAPDDEGFRPATVSSFTSLSADPPQVMIALKSDSRVMELAKEAGVFFVSVLADDQESISNSYAKFDSELLHEPHIDDAVATFTCTTEEILMPSYGTHVILIGRVDTCANELKRLPLLYWNRAYRRLT